METKKKKILLIDDNEIVRLMFSNVFWLHGLEDNYELTTVGTIEEAFTFIGNPTTRPDIVFTGLVMPYMNGNKIETTAEAGFSLLKRIKSQPETLPIRVIVFSGYKEQDYRSQALAMGAEMFLEKGENMPQDILQIIRNLDSNSK